MIKKHQLFKMPESFTFKGFVYDVIVTVVLGVALSVFWDIYKYKHESHQREQSLCSAVCEEFTDNLEIIEENQKVIYQDMELLKVRKYAVKPLRLLQIDSLKLLIDAPPSMLMQDVKSLQTLRAVKRRSCEINEIIRSRELYRIIAQPTTSFVTGMEEYDRILLIGFKPLPKTIESIKAKIQ